MNSKCTCPSTDLLAAAQCPEHGYRARPKEWPRLQWVCTGEMRWAVTRAWVRGRVRDEIIDTRVLEQRWEAYVEHNAGCTQRVENEWRPVASVVVKEDRSAIA